MDLNDELRAQRQAARISELETWLGMLIVAHGVPTLTGWQYALTQEHAEELRARMPRSEVVVVVDVDVVRHIIKLDAL